MRRYGQDWWLVAEEIVSGARVIGAGIEGIRIEHDQEDGRTLLKCWPSKPGKVSVVLSTRHGPVEWKDVATVEGEVDPFAGRWQGTIRSRRVKGRHPPEWFAKGGLEITQDLPVGEWEEARSFSFRVVREEEQTIRVFFGSAAKGDAFVVNDNVARRQSRNKNFTQDSRPGVISIVQRDWDWTLTRKEDQIHGKVYCTTLFSDGLSEREEFEIKAKSTEQIE
jgi:hypothetical protein